MRSLSRKIKVLLLFSIVLLYVVLPGWAQTGGWKQEEGGRIRISLDGNPRGTEEAQAYGLVEVELKPGWKTYWKNPGSSGFAPELELTHVATDGQEKKLVTQLLFPTPRKLPEKKGEGWIYGYQHRVALPFRLTLPSRTGEVSGHLLIGLCDDVCIPVSIDFAFDLGDTADFLTKGRIEAALAALP